MITSFFKWWIYSSHLNLKIIKTVISIDTKVNNFIPKCELQLKWLFMQFYVIITMIIEQFYNFIYIVVKYMTYNDKNAIKQHKTLFFEFLLYICIALLIIVLIIIIIIYL